MKPGMSAVRLNSAPNSSSQITGCTSEIADPGRLAQERPDVAERDLPGVADTRSCCHLLGLGVRLAKERPAWRR